MTLGQALRRARERQGINQRDLATRLAVDQGNLSRRENDRVSVPSNELERFTAETGEALRLGPEGWSLDETPVTALACRGRVPSGEGVGEPLPALVDLPALSGGGAHAGCYLLRAAGDTFLAAGIYEGDWLLVDPEREARPQQVVVTWEKGQLTLKRLVHHPQTGRPMLVPLTARFLPLEVTVGEALDLRGVVIGRLSFVPLA